MKNLLHFLLLLALAGAGSAQPMPWSSEHFEGGGICIACHLQESIGYQIPGEDPSPTYNWAGTMMSMAGLDPYFLAKLSAETSTLPDSTAAGVEDFCLRCHGPLARAEVHWAENRPYRLDEHLTDVRGLDGVSCTACHMTAPVQVDSSHWSGNLEYNQQRRVYGPHQDPSTEPMEATIELEPTFSEHIRDRDFCSGCHMLQTEIRDTEGNLLGHFPEQSTWAETRNSDLHDLSCQDCHMPVQEDSLFICGVPGYAILRSPTRQHAFLGGNTMMLELFRDNTESQGWPFSAEEFERVRQRTVEFLQTAATLELSQEVLGDTLQIKANICNVTAHKLPTGIPLRRMWLEVVVRNTEGDLVLHSGDEDWQGHLGTDGLLQNHRNVIRSSQDLQIWEARMADLDGEATWTLLEAADWAKDNRLQPAGWSANGPYADMTAAAGDCTQDPDFHMDGNGCDTVSILLSAEETLHIEVRVRFQSVNPEAVDALRTADTELVHSFLNLWDSQIHSSEILAEAVLEYDPDLSVATPDPEPRLELLGASPNPFNPVTRIHFELSRSSLVHFKLFSLLGERLQIQQSRVYLPGRHTFLVDGSSLSSGTYVYSLQAGEELLTGRVLLLK